MIHLKNSFVLILLILFANTKLCFGQYNVIVNSLENSKTKSEFVIFSDSTKLVKYQQDKIKELRQNGFENSYSFIESVKSDTLTLWIVEGNKYFFDIKKITYADSTSLPLSKKLEGAFRTKTSYFNLQNCIENSLTYYENSGYPFAAISYDSVTFSDHFSGTLIIRQNKKYLFDSIVIKGDAKISESFLRQFYKLNRNTPYSEKKLKQIEKLTKQIPFLSMAQNPEVLFTDSECRTYLFLNKRKSNSFDGIIGFIPSTNNSKAIQLTGDLKLKLLNAFSHGEQLSFDWRGYEANSQDLNLKSIIPFWFSSPFGTEFNFKLNKKDSSFINLQYQIGVSYYLSGFDNIKGFFESSTSNTFTNNSSENSNFRSSKFNSYGLEINILRLNDIVLATQGYSLKTSFLAGTIAHSSSLQQNEEKSTRYVLQLQTPFFIPIYKRFILANSIQSVYINSKKIYENEMLRLGGLKTLKGFNEDELLASFYTIFSTEIRFMLEKYSYLSIFWNGAYYEKQSISNKICDTPWGLGIGLAFNTPAGIFSLNYALGKQFNNSLDLRNSKIHFGITGSF